MWPSSSSFAHPCLCSPSQRCDTRQQWKGSASEQRLLTSLGLWEIAEQAREWEEAEAAAGARYDRIGSVFGARGSCTASVAGSPPSASMSGLSLAGNSRRSSRLQEVESRRISSNITELMAEASLGKVRVSIS